MLWQIAKRYVPCGFSRYVDNSNMLDNIDLDHEEGIRTEAKIHPVTRSAIIRNRNTANFDVGKNLTLIGIVVLTAPDMKIAGVIAQLHKLHLMRKRRLIKVRIVFYTYALYKTTSAGYIRKTFSKLKRLFTSEILIHRVGGKFWVPRPPDFRSRVTNCRDNNFHRPLVDRSRFFDPADVCTFKRLR